MFSMRSTTSSGVGTQTTSLPCWPTWGLKSFCWAYAALAVTSSAAVSAARMPLGIARLDLDPGADQVARGGPAPFARVLVGLVENVEIVLERSHPGRHFFLFGARQEADVFADRHGDPGHDDLGVMLGLEGLHKAG